MKHLSLFLFLCIFFALAMLLTPSSAMALRPGDEAPDFTLQELTLPESALNESGDEDDAVSLSSFRGRVVFLNFWESWCAPCKEEIPKLSALALKFGGSDMVVLAVTVDKKRSHVDDFLKDVTPLSKNLIVLFDPGSTVIPKYEAMAMPTSFVIDRAGVIRFVHFGYLDKDPQKWAIEVDTLIKEEVK